MELGWLCAARQPIPTSDYHKSGEAFASLSTVAVEAEDFAVVAVIVVGAGRIINKEETDVASAVVGPGTECCSADK